MEHIINIYKSSSLMVVIVVLFGGFVLSETSAQETALYVSEEGNYSLRPDFPALKLGFKPVDLSRVCLRGGAQ